MMTGSAFRGSGWRTRWTASKLDVWSVGISSSVNIDRMTSRMASVGMMRVIPSRPASWVATVDFPTPVAPPMRMMRGRSMRFTTCHLANESA